MTGRERRLINAAKEGDRTAFGKIVESYQDRILFLAFDLMGNYDDAKDLAQEVFIRAFQKLTQFEERSKISTWLYRITVNLAMDTHRKTRNNQMVSIDIDIETPIEDPGSRRIERAETRAQIESALDILSLNQRTAIVLKYFHEREPREIAEMMGCTQSTVRNHLFRAMQKLRKVLEPTI
jgi:RNA polymerase sigma-70 factor (ECF subfamily)